VDTSRIIYPEVYCDETRITQILLNLLSNAVKYTGPGGEIQLEIIQRPGGGNRRYCKYEFIVSDNGIGISKDFLSRVFEPFERESGRIGNTSYGSGLGMSIAKGIVDLMGGSIRVESEEDAGTRFTVELEFRPFIGKDREEFNEDDEKDGDRTDGQSADGQDTNDSDSDDLAVFRNSLMKKGSQDNEAGWIEGRRLLLVEDNPLNREIAVEMLVEDGFKVDVAENGRIAISKIVSSDPWYYSAVLMDIQMPVMDGYEATKNIRALPDRSRASIPIIAMTANAFKEDRTRAADCGMDAYITKPVDVLALRYVLRRVLR
jgi:CheY-like chemotaxis protein/anti-sigma regulatory factor (Ser/Thr protein kinase)